MNLCTVCTLDFGSVSAFDRHRVGVHEYTFAQGAKMEPPRYDGRRCLSVSEMEALTDKNGSPTFAKNARGTWSMGRSVEGASEATAKLREAS